MWATTKDMIEAGKGRERNSVSPATVTCPHLILAPWPQAPQANSGFWSVLLSVSAGLTQARRAERESNYWDNYDCDLVRPGFVFKWTHLPWALERRLLRTDCEPRVLCPPVFLLQHRWLCCIQAHTPTLLMLICQLNASWISFFIRWFKQIYLMLSIRSPLEQGANSIL